MSDAFVAHLTESLAIERRRVDKLLDMLATTTVHALVTPAAVDVGEPDVPPDAVMAAMKRISPTRDKAFEANWFYWLANKERAAAHPDAFAAEIIEGASIEVAGS